MLDSTLKSSYQVSAELRPSPVIAAGLLAAAAWAINWFNLATESTMLLFELFLYIMAGVILVTNPWRPRLSRWLTVLTMLGVVGLGLTWLKLPGVETFLPLPVLLAAILLRLSAAGLLAAIETALLVIGAAYIGLDTATVVIFLTAIWVTFGALVMLYQPIYQTLDWFGDYTRRTQQWIEEERSSKVDLKQTLADLAHANRELMLLNERVAAMRQVAEQARQAKAAFVAKISHEFRTPLNMIIGLIDTLTAKPEVYEQEIPPALLEDLEIVRRSSDHLAGMINDVLDMSQTETGRLQLRLEWADLAADIQNAVLVVQPLIEKKHLTLQLNLPADLPPVYYDRTRIRQVALNLVSNAARYTDAGSITLSVKRQDNDVLVSVADTGPGILPEDAAHIFEPFYQGITGRLRRERDGSGLGLSVCQQLVGLHHGQIWAQSQSGAGSTFHFTLPIVPYTPSAAKPKSRVSEDWVYHERVSWPKLPRLPYRQRLVVCDETGELYPLLTRAFPEIEFVDARDVAQTLAELQNCPAHAVILNTASPNTLGPLAAQSRLKISDTPIIGCSFPPHVNYIFNAGALDYLIKPVRQADLEKALGKAGRPLKRILVVDDNPDVLQLFTRMLRLPGQNWEIDTAANGEEALTKLRLNPPDLVLLDIMMPVLDGWQVLQQKEQEAAIKDIPVIMVSAEDPARQPMSSEVVLLTMGPGLSLNRVVECALTFSALLWQIGQAPGQAPG